MTQRTQRQKKASSTTTEQLTRLGDTVATWWWALPITQRRSFCATAGGFIAILMLAGLLPAARQSWIALLAIPASVLLGWGAAPTLLGMLIIAGVIIAESIVRKPLMRAGWFWCVAVALLLVLAESRLLFGSPLGGFMGALGAFPLRRLPAAAGQMFIVGALMLDALIAFRISWHEVRQVTRWLTQRGIAPPIIPLATPPPTGSRHAEKFMSSPAINGGGSVMPPLSRVSPLALAHEDSERQLATHLPTDFSTDQAREALRVPAYLRRGGASQNPVTAPQAVADKDFALPPLPLRWDATTAEPLAATTLRAAPSRETDEQLVLAKLFPEPRTPAAHTATATMAEPALPPLIVLRDERSHITWSLPPLSLLNAATAHRPGNASEHAERLATIIERTLKSFGVDAEVRRGDISVGPTIMRFGIRPSERVRTDEHGRALVDAQGEPIFVRTRVSHIMNLKDDLVLVLEVKTLRMEAPVPERPYIGVEIPNVYER